MTAKIAAMLIVASLLGTNLITGAVMKNSGYRRGWTSAMIRRDADKAAHDEAMRKIGLCQWAKKIADYAMCGGHTPNPGESDTATCKADEEKCS